MSDAKKAPLDTAAAETVLAQLAAKAEKQGEKSKKAAKKVKKIGKGIKQVLKTYDLDENIVEIAPKIAQDFNNGVENLELDAKTPLHAVLTIADMLAVQDNFNTKSPKKAGKQADYGRAADMVRKAFKIEAPKAPLPTGPREIVFAVDMAGQTLRQVLPVIDAAYKTASDNVVTAGRKARVSVAHFANGTWMELGVDGYTKYETDAEYKKLLTDALAMPIFKSAGFESIANQITGDSRQRRTVPVAQHFVLVVNHDAAAADKLQDALAKNPSATVDIIATKGADVAALGSLRDAFPRRVALHAAPTSAALASTLSLVANQRLDQRIDALNAKPRKAPTP